MSVVYLLLVGLATQLDLVIFRLFLGAPLDYDVHSIGIPPYNGSYYYDVESLLGIVV